MTKLRSGCVRWQSDAKEVTAKPSPWLFVNTVSKDSMVIGSTPVDVTLKKFTNAPEGLVGGKLHNKIHKL